ncbi:spore coat U domain-containing protein, partial [Nostoc sp. NIES-2111]
MRRWTGSAPALGLLFLAWAGGAAAQPAPSCTAAGEVAFGQVDTTSGTVATATGSLTVDCAGGTADTAYTVCLGPLSRPLNLSGPRAVEFDLFTDQAGAGRFAFQTATTLQVTTNGTGQGSSRLPVYARITTAPAQILAGIYSASVPLGGAACSGGIAATGSLVASANVIRKCTVQVTRDVAFGVLNPGERVWTANGMLAVTCTQGVAYAISLGPGSSGNVNARSMRSGTNTLPYGLFMDPAYAEPWGVAPKGGTGTGRSDQHPVFGRISRTPLPAPGQYRDEVGGTV